MEVKTNNEEEKRPVSVLQGDGFCINRILARETSVGQSSRTFYRVAEGVPFEWEMHPGTPKNPQEEDAVPPICPSPLMQSLGLSLPNLDHDEVDESAQKMSKIKRLRKMVKKRINSDVIKKVEVVLGVRSKEKDSSRFGDSNGELLVKDSSFSSTSSSLFLPDNRVLDSSTIDGPFCCSPLDVPAILEEGNRTIYYCSQHKAAFAVEEDGTFLSRILSRVSAGDQFSGPLTTEVPPAGIPFGWEMQPGTPKHPRENELIPPPSPPPAVQSMSLPQPRLHAGGERDEKTAWKRAWHWIRHYNKKKESLSDHHQKVPHEMSFRCNGNKKISNLGEDMEASFRESGSVPSAAPLSKGGWRVSRIRRTLEGSNSSCGPWSKKDILVFARRKFKSFTS